MDAEKTSLRTTLEYPYHLSGELCEANLSRSRLRSDGAVIKMHHVTTHSLPFLYVLILSFISFHPYSDILLNFNVHPFLSFLFLLLFYNTFLYFILYLFLSFLLILLLLFIACYNNGKAAPVLN
jgi:hypothetical protein